MLNKRVSGVMSNELILGCGGKIKVRVNGSALLYDKR